MQLAKNVIDVGLSTNNLELILGFWQREVGLRFDHVLPVRRGQKQYRHDAMGSVVKLNHHLAPLQDAPHRGPFHLVPVISRAISERLEKVFPSRGKPLFPSPRPGRSCDSRFAPAQSPA
jgi:hypothetical protein